MTAGAATLLVVAILAAFVDWIAVSSRVPSVARLEMIAKPAVPLALLGVAALATTPDPTGRVLVIVALIFCTIGDVAPMLDDPHDRLFILGLGAFLIAQVIFAIAFLTASHGSLVLVGCIVVLCTALPASVVLRAVGRTDRTLVAPVAVYVVAILTMATAAIAASLGELSVLCAIGGISFVCSDLLLATNRFVRPLPHQALVVHMTYHLGIAGLTLGMLVRA